MESTRVTRLVAALEQATGRQVLYVVRPDSPNIEVEFVGGPSTFVLVSFRDLENKPVEEIVHHIMKAVSFDGIKYIGEEKSQGRPIDPDLEKRFTYHQPKPGQPEKYQRIRDMAKELAYAIKEEAGIHRETSLALTSLEETVFWTNASIARNG